MEPSPPNASDVEILFHLLSRAHHQMIGILQREIGKLDGNGGLQPGMRHLFCALAHQDGMTVSELADHLRMAKSSITGAIKRMETAGLAEMKPDATDLRIKRVVLTERGRALQPACARIDAVISEKLDTEFTAEERDQLPQMLDRLIRLLAAAEEE
ncbi:MAG: MarR family winged helix-turn-helix transcriptional regulator [Verrucomicrobiales bacterium]